MAEVELRPIAGTDVVDGDAPHIVVAGLAPGERVTVHLFRQAMAYAINDYPGKPVLAHAQAVFAADKNGTLAVDTATANAGTYIGVDALGLLWSGSRVPETGDLTQPITQHVFLANGSDLLVRVEAASVHQAPWLETRLRLTDGSTDLSVVDVSMSGLAGVFARPKKASSQALPAILLLHGSEGGTQASARASATRFARLGYAAFSVIYFAWPGTGVTGVPQALMNVPVETLANARAWLMQQPGVDARTVSVWGVSKGAEFALVGAAEYPWIDHVVACVPSSVMWTGFGRALLPGEVDSSWSLGGKGLPGIGRDGWEDVTNLRWSSAFVHQRSLDMASEKQLAEARIPVERIKAKMLLFAAEKDVVWPSSLMTRQIEATLRVHGKKDRERSMVFPNASHYICGTGSEMRRVNPVHRPEGDDPSPEADAHATENAWEATKSFLRQQESPARTLSLPLR